METWTALRRKGLQDPIVAAGLQSFEVDAAIPIYNYQRAITSHKCGFQ